MFTYTINAGPAECKCILFRKHCRPKSAGFSRSHLIRIHTVFHSGWKYMLTTRMMQDNNKEVVYLHKNILQRDNG